MSSLSPEALGPGFIGQVLDDDGATVGTCWLVAPGWVLTAAHVAQAAGADVVAASVTAERAFSAAADRADERAVTLWLRRGLAETGAVIEGRVRRADTVVDLALVEIDAEAWDSAPAELADSTGLEGKTVVVTGMAELADAREDAALIASSTTGSWDGWGLFNDSLYLPKIKASGALPNMSGAPVLRAGVSTVLGLVRSRYNSADGWGRDIVWVVGSRAIEQFCRPLIGPLLPPPPAPTQAVHVVLRPTRETVSLVCEELDTRVVEPCRGARSRLFPASERLRLARRGLVEARRSGKQAPGGQVGEPTPLLDALEEIGSLMGEVFLPGAVGEALTRILAKARSQTIPVEFAVDPTECPEELRGLPWEGLRHPEVDGPLALHPLVVFYRLAVASPTPRRVDGPLRIVVAIAAPLDGEPKLDYESELRNIVSSSVREAKAGGAEVRIVTFATTSEIKKALDAGDVHVLHISCHGSAGRLILEDENGNARPVTARTLIEEAIPPGKMPPVICLSACDTNVTDRSGGLPAVADELVSSGAPAVIGTETSVSDRYATLVFARVYAELAKATEQPDPATALAAARRQVLRACENSERGRDRHEQVLSGWSVVTIQAASSREALFDPKTVRSGQRAPSKAIPMLGKIPALKVGSFVGRRREQLEIPRFLADEDRGGVVLHGIGGIGKTSLAGEILRRSREQRPDLVVVTVSGTITAEGLLNRIITGLRITLLKQHSDSAHLGILNMLGDPRAIEDWDTRVRILQDDFLGQMPIIIVLDNFEDNLQPIQSDDNSQRNDPKSHERRRISEQQLADFLAALARTPGPSSLLITCRYRFELPDDGGEYLRWWGLGPLSFSETLRLAWDLPHVEALDDYQLHMLWAGIGGHPRTLEMLDALLGHGRGRLPRIEQELKQRLKETLPDGMDVDSWLDRPRDLDVSVAEAVTLAANDVLLPQLLNFLSPEAKRLLMGLALFRRPVERSAAAFVLGTFTERDTTANETNDAPAPPFATDLPVDDLLDELVSTTLLTRLQSADSSSPQWFVHRWTASALERQEGSAAETAKKNNADRHRRAALYWMWHYWTTAQSREADVDDLMECYAHFGEAGDAEQADDTAQRAASILNRIGRWDDEWALANRQFQNTHLSKARQAAWRHQLGILAQRRGDYDTARKLYEQSLHIEEELGNRAGMANTYGQLGILAHDQSDYDTAHTRYQQALTIFEELGDRVNIAKVRRNLDILAQDQNDT